WPVTSTGWQERERISREEVAAPIVAWRGRASAGPPAHTEHDRRRQQRDEVARRGVATELERARAFGLLVHALWREARFGPWIALVEGRRLWRIRVADRVDVVLLERAERSRVAAAVVVERHRRLARADVRVREAEEMAAFVRDDRQEVGHPHRPIER